MTTILKNTANTGTGYIQLPSGTTNQRPAIQTTTQSFTTVGTTSWTAPTGVYSVEVLVVAGGGGGGGYYVGGGGGGGGVVYNSAYAVIPGNNYTVTVGAGGVGPAASQIQGTSGGNSVFGTITAIGGGGGGSYSGAVNGLNGGSGGGAAFAGLPGLGTAGQGYPGGKTGSDPNRGGGGGGAGGPGLSTDRPHGGPGIGYSISGSLVYYSAGGGAGNDTWGGTGGIGGGGHGGGGSLGGQGGGTGVTGASAGTNATGYGCGGGGAGGNSVVAAGNGYQGIVIIRYSTAGTIDDSRGLVRYNTELRDIEVYENPANGWVGQDPMKNFAGHNLLKYSQNFSTWWTLQGITLTASNVLAPDGTNTASLLTVSTGYTPLWRNLDHYTAVAGGIYTVSGYFKAGTSSRFSLTLGNAGLTNCINVLFDLSTQTIIGAEGGGAYTRGASTYIGSSITNAGNGWYRCAITGIVDSSTTNIRVDYPLENSKTINVWGLQTEYATSAGPYVKTADQMSPIPAAIGGYRIHTYTNVGTSGFSPAVSGLIEVLVVAGGGSGGRPYGGGGGGGGVIYNSAYHVISGQQYAVTIGAGGDALAASLGVCTRGNNGNNSVFGAITAIGGGGGGCWGTEGTTGGDDPARGKNGGSAGGGGCRNDAPALIRDGQYSGYPVTGQGNLGGVGTQYLNAGSGGGGGAGGAGAPGANQFVGGVGGPGIVSSISGTAVYYGPGGGGGVGNATGTYSPAAGGIGGGGSGGYAISAVAYSGTAGAANTGGGGGGASGTGQGSTANTAAASGAGGSGIVIVRYRYD